ncbi:GNAT family N-acetyltransferase [uncultured Sulfitobacter sp.]|uniref:GNAT family N-acetyltransferase n=1 Tax=uncultured Sulfitobacter sp. TaxID=191468 RepID=UPI002617F711|nr:GNAT family N-acetyltransferase [uncultured Sulfitobacter sp.]
MKNDADSGLTLREAGLDDVKDIVRIHRLSRATAMPWLPVVHSAEEDLWFFTNRVLPMQNVHVACLDDTVVGFAAHHDGWLNHLYIAAGHWRQGVGHMLLSQAQSANDSLQLWTFAENLVAQVFYDRAGFQVVDRTDGRRNEEKTPDLRMEWHRAFTQASL